MEEPDQLDAKYVVARAKDLPDGARILVNVRGRSIGVFNVEGRFYAVLNRCPHHGGQLCKGDVIGLVESDRPGDMRLDRSKKLIACPWHAWEFDLETGQSWFNPERTRARPFAVSAVSGEDVAREVEAGSARAPASPDARFVDPVGHRIKGPYTASVLPVEVEDEYLVLSLRNVAALGQEVAR